MTKMLIIFTVLTIANVIMSTIKSIVTIKADKWIASFVSALYYGYYNVVLIYTVADFPLWQKVLVTFACNLIGVFIVKWTEEKARKDKLWQLSITIPKENIKDLYSDYTVYNISHNYIEAGPWGIFTVYCETQQETTVAVDLAKKYKAKMFATENKLSL